MEESLVAWRPTNMDRYESDQTTDVIEEDAKEYLAKPAAFVANARFSVSRIPSSISVTASSAKNLIKTVAMMHRLGMRLAFLK